MSDKSKTKNISVSNTNTQLNAYMKHVLSYPILSREEELALAKAWYYNQDKEAAQKLIVSHLRLVVKVAYQFKGYGLNVSDLISEGNIGLMQAIKKFDPEKGFRVTTYAVWWIRATIIEYILRSWSIVRIGTVSGRKKLFFSLNSIKRKLNSLDKTLSDVDIKAISKEHGVSEQDVREINLLFTSKDTSLSEPAYRSNDGSPVDFGDLLPDNKKNPEEEMIENNSLEYNKKILSQALSTLSPREQEIIQARFKEGDNDSLEVLGQRYGVSRERIRQIESRALEKLKSVLLSQGIQPALITG